MPRHPELAEAQPDFAAPPPPEAWAPFDLLTDLVAYLLALSPESRARRLAAIARDQPVFAA
eukprot:3696308-Lingulodinium_polyedra.AAC.1